MALGAFGGGGGAAAAKDWKEEVRLRTGETVLLERSVGRGLGGRWQPGQGPVDAASISFKWGGKTIRWKLGDTDGMPFVLDVFDGAPVLVMPVLGAAKCYEHGYPADGLLAWRHDGRKWIRMASAPEGATINLRNGIPERDDKAVVTVQWKEQNQGARAGGPYGKPAAKFAASISETCARLPGTPNPEVDALMQPVIDAESSAPTVVAERVSFATTPETVTSADARKAMGEWIDNANVWNAVACRNWIRGFTPRRRPGPPAQQEISGYVIDLFAKAPAPRIGVRSKPALSNLACEQGRILVVRRDTADRILVNRFDRAGRIVDATWIHLPGAAEAATDARVPPAIWNVATAGSTLRVTLADYAFNGDPTQGGTLRRKAVYEAPLPER